MKKSLPFGKGILTLAILTMFGVSCSTPQYYVYKTVTHHPHVKQEVQENEKQEGQSATAIQLETSATSNTEATLEVSAITSPATKVNEEVSLAKAAQTIARKAAPQQQEKISKIEQVKTAIKVKKEIKKFKKSLDTNGQEATNEESKSQLVALLLAAFVGTIGIHRFYLGYTTIGIIQILTLGGCGIWALIDLIRIAMGDLKPADGSDYDPEL